MAQKRKAGCESNQDTPLISHHDKKICSMQVINSEQFAPHPMTGSTDFEKAEAKFCPWFP